VLFGSQAPIYDQDFELHRVLWAHIQDETKKQILGKNALNLLGRVDS
jgi:predicted TIM-barrel fold metal-dependent hydrolase